MNFESLLSIAVIDSLTSNVTHSSNWRFGEEVNWDLDWDIGKILLTFDSDYFALAEIEVIGTYYHNKSCFRWAWADQRVPKRLTGHVQALRSFGEFSKYDVLTTAEVECTCVRSWEFAALSMWINGSSAVYQIEVENQITMFLNLEKINCLTGLSFPR